MLEGFVFATDLLIRIFAVLLAVLALLYFFSSRQLHKIHAQENTARLAQPKQQADNGAEMLQAQNEIQKLKSDNAALAASLEQEHEARLLAQWRLGPRFVPRTARAEIIQTLQPFAGRRLNFGYFTDLETAEFAEDLLDVVKSAGWKPQVFKIKAIQPIYGIECGSPNPQDPALRALTDALKIIDTHIAAEESAAPSGQMLQPLLTEQTELWIMVGLKRPHLRKKLPVDAAAPSPARPS